MATLTLEDLEGTVEVTVFARTFQECRDILASPEPVFLLGRVKHEEQVVKVNADEVFLMSTVRERLARSVHFRLYLDRPGSPDIQDLARTVHRYSGEKKAFLHLIRKGDFEAIIALPDSLGVSPSLDLARELKTRFGYGVLQIN